MPQKQLSGYLPSKVKPLLATALLFMVVGFADEIPNLTQPALNNNPLTKGQFVYYYRGETLRQALVIFAKSNGLAINFSTGTEAGLFNKAVIGRFMVTDNNSLLNMLASKYNFNWFIYSGTLYLASTQVVNKSVNVSSDAFKMIKSNLQQIGLLNEKFGYSEIPSENKIVISGPKVYVDLVAAQINSLKVSPDKQQYAVYRLKYANAVDTQLSFNNQTITIPGVVTILQNLANAKTGTGGLVTNVSELIKNTNTTGSKESAPINPNASAGSTSNNQSTSNYSIQADPRTNSVILIGDQAQVNMYKNLINRIDTPSVLVQVDVMIIHLNQGALDQAGVNWSALLGGGTVVGSNNTATTFNRAAPGDVLVTSLKNINLEVKALSENNLAEVTSKPSLVTENNLPAILSVSENLYSPTNSSLSNYGQLANGLQITPHVVFEDNGQKLIRLSIVLDDGAQGEDGFAAASLIQSTLTSQAVIGEGQSVLLAGHSRNTKVKRESKVPGLGDIPILGWLFKSSSTSLQKMTTLFLITPKILWAPDTYTLGNSLTIDGRKIDTSNNNAKINLEPSPDNK